MHPNLVLALADTHIPSISTAGLSLSEPGEAPLASCSDTLKNNLLCGIFKNHWCLRLTPDQLNRNPWGLGPHLGNSLTFSGNSKCVARVEAHFGNALYWFLSQGSVQLGRPGVDLAQGQSLRWPVGSISSLYTVSPGRILGSSPPGEVAALIDWRFPLACFCLYWNNKRIWNTKSRRRNWLAWQFVMRRHFPLSNGVLRGCNFGASLFLHLILDSVWKPLFRA